MSSVPLPQKLVAGVVVAPEGAGGPAGGQAVAGHLGDDLAQAVAGQVEGVALLKGPGDPRQDIDHRLLRQAVEVVVLILRRAGEVVVAGGGIGIDELVDPQAVAGLVEGVVEEGQLAGGAFGGQAQEPAERVIAPRRRPALQGSDRALQRRGESAALPDGLADDQEHAVPPTVPGQDHSSEAPATPPARQW